MAPGTLSGLLQKGAIWGFIVLELIFFSVAGEFLSLSDKAFMDLDNMLLLLKQSAPIGIIAMGMTIVMINGNIDLSVGATFALAAIVLLDSMTWPIFAGLGDGVIPVAMALALLTGIVLGAINGFIVWKTGVDAFIVTLGAMLGYRGLVFMYNGEQPTGHLNWTLVDLAEAQPLGLHVATWALLIVTVLAWLVMTRTVHGRNAYAIGDNREAAVNAGIRVGPHMMLNFMGIGFLAALSAVVFYSESGSVNPNDGELIAIQLLRKGLGHIGADTETVNLVIGLILIAVLFLDRQLNIKGKEALKA